MKTCKGHGRQNCVVDGDTFWLSGVKYRLACIDAKEIDDGEDGIRARDVLARALASPSRKIIPANKKGARGRPLARVETWYGDVGRALVEVGLAKFGNYSNVRAFCKEVWN